MFVDFFFWFVWLVLAGDAQTTIIPIIGIIVSFWGVCTLDYAWPIRALRDFWPGLLWKKEEKKQPKKFPSIFFPFFSSLPFPTASFTWESCLIFTFSSLRSSKWTQTSAGKDLLLWRKPSSCKKLFLTLSDHQPLWQPHSSPRSSKTTSKWPFQWTPPWRTPKRKKRGKERKEKRRKKRRRKRTNLLFSAPSPPPSSFAALSGLVLTVTPSLLWMSRCQWHGRSREHRTKWEKRRRWKKERKKERRKKHLPPSPLLPQFADQPVCSPSQLLPVFMLFPLLHARGGWLWVERRRRMEHEAIAMVKKEETHSLPSVRASAACTLKTSRSVVEIF